MIPDQKTTGFSVMRLKGLRIFSPSPPKAEVERRTENSGRMRSTICLVLTMSAAWRKK